MSKGKECFSDLFDDSDVDDEISSFIQDFGQKQKLPTKNVKPEQKLSAKDVKPEPNKLAAKDVKTEPNLKLSIKDTKSELEEKLPAKDVKSEPKQKPTAKDTKPESKQLTVENVKPGTKQKIPAKDIPSLMKEDKVVPKTVANEQVSSNNVSNEPKHKPTAKDVKPEPKQKQPAKDVKPEPKQKQPAKDVKPETKQNVSAKEIPSSTKQEKNIAPKPMPIANEQVSSNNMSGIMGSNASNICDSIDHEQKEILVCGDLKNRANVSGKPEQNVSNTKDLKNKTEGRPTTNINNEQKKIVKKVVSKNEERKSDEICKDTPLKVNSKSSSKDLLVNDDLESLLNEKSEAGSNGSHLSPISSEGSLLLDNTELEKEIENFLGKDVETQITDTVNSSSDTKTELKSVSEMKSLKGILKKEKVSSQTKEDEANLQDSRQNDGKRKEEGRDSITRKSESSVSDSHKKRNEGKRKADEEDTESSNSKQNERKNKEESDSLKRKAELSDLDSHRKKDGNKRKAERNTEESDSKKRKTESNESTAYDRTIASKMDHITEKFVKLNDYLIKKFEYHKYTTDHLLCYRVRREKSQFSFEMDDIRECPPNERSAVVYSFAIGSDQYTNELSVGWRVERADKPGDKVGDYQKVKKCSDEKHYLPNNIADLMKVFEKMIQAHARDRVDSAKKIWKDLYIYVNRRQELTINVIVFFSTSIVKEIHSLLVDFFKSGEGKRFRVTSVYVTCYYKMGRREEFVSELIMGRNCFEIMHGLNIQFVMSAENWSSLYGLKMICQGVEELLTPNRNTCIMDIFCSSGLVGFYLSKIAGEILAYDDVEIIKITKKNAIRNDITGILYFSGNCEDIEYQVRRSKYDDVAAIINWNSTNNHDLSITEVAKTLRKITRLNKLVMIVNSKALPNIPFWILCGHKEPGEPFVMVMVIPIDAMPFQSGYTVLMLFLRNSEVCGKFVPFQGLYRTSRSNVKDYYWWNWLHEVDTKTKQKGDELKNRMEEEVKRKIRKQLERKRKEEEEEEKQKMEEERKRKLQEELVKKKQEELERIRNEEEEQRKKEEEERQKKEQEEKAKRLTFFKKRLRVEQLRRAQGDQKNDGDKEQYKEEDHEAKKKKEIEEQKKQAQKVEKKKQSEKKNEPLEQLRRQIEEEKVRAKRNAERRRQQQIEEKKRKTEEEERRMEQPRIPVWEEPPTAQLDFMMEEQRRMMIEAERRKRMEDEVYRRHLEEEAYRTVETKTVVFDYNHGSSKQEQEDLNKPKTNINVPPLNPVSYPIMNRVAATAATTVAATATTAAGASSNTVSRPVMKWLEKLREVSGDADKTKASYVKDASPQQTNSGPPSLLSLKVEKPLSLSESKINLAVESSSQSQSQQSDGKSSAPVNPWSKTPGLFGAPSLDQANRSYGATVSASGLNNLYGTAAGSNNMSCIDSRGKDQWTGGSRMYGAAAGSIDPVSMDIRKSGSSSSNLYGASTTSNTITGVGAGGPKSYGSGLSNMYGGATSGSTDHRLIGYGVGTAGAAASSLDQRISVSRLSNVFGTAPGSNSPADYVNVRGTDQRPSSSSYSNYYSSAAGSNVTADSVDTQSTSHRNSSKLYGSTGGPTPTADPRGRPGLLGPAPSMSDTFSSRDNFSNLPNPSKRFGYGGGTNNQQQSLVAVSDRNIGTYGSHSERQRDMLAGHSGRLLDFNNTSGVYNYSGGELDWNKRNAGNERASHGVSEENFSFLKTLNEARSIGSSYLGKP